MSTVGTAHAHHLDLTWPRFGGWRLDAVLEGGDVPAPGSAVSAVVGDLALSGRVLRSGLDAPDRPHVVVVGGLGWESVLAAPLSWQSDAGVTLAMVVRELAALAGEPVEAPPDAVIGLAYAVPAGRLVRDALGALVTSGHLPPWRVDPDGVARFGARPTDGAAVTVRATVLRRDAGVGLTVLGIDSPAAFAPGKTVDVGAAAPVMIERLVIHETTGRLEAEVYG